MIQRPTVLGLALAQAAIKLSKKVDHAAGKLPWTARRVLLNLDRDGIGIKREPSWNAHLAFKTAQELKVRGILA